MEQTGPFGQLVWFVPAANHVLNGGVETSLSQTDEEADCGDAFEPGRSGEDHSKRAPNQFHSGDPHRWTDPGDENATIAYE